MQIKNLDVAKRQTNEKDDHIYGTLTLSNSDYELKADCYFRYNYYDEGGWILDYGEINGDYKLSPLSKISKNSAEESLNIPSAISC